LFLTLIPPAETRCLWHGWQIALKGKKLLNICVNQSLGLRHKASPSGLTERNLRLIILLDLFSAVNLFCAEAAATAGLLFTSRAVKEWLAMAPR